MDVSIIIVNFNSGALLSGCLESLKGQVPDGMEGEILVVDSRSTLEQRLFLEEARRYGAAVIEMDRNLGYAGGCNRGFRESSGRFLFFLNADVLAVERCMPLLIDHLERHPDTGLVEPRTYLDRERAFIIPEIHLLTRRQLFHTGWARISGKAAHRFSISRLKRTLKYWRAAGPLRVKTLSGAFLGTRRDVLERLGGFDEGFPLFYEDTDLFARVRKAGLDVVLFPGSEAVHFAHRSIATVWEEANAKMRLGRTRYIRRHLGPFTAFFNAAFERFVDGWSRRRAPAPQGERTDLGPTDAPPALAWEGSGGPCLLELALDPHFNLAAGHFGEGRSYAFSQETWDSFLPGPYHLRALDLENLDVLGCWRVEKV